MVARTLFVVALVAVVSLTGCSNYVLKSQYDRDVEALRLANDALTARNMELEPLALKTRVGDLESAHAAISKDIYDDLSKRIAGLLGGGGGMVDFQKDRVIVSETASGEALFERGKSVITPKFREILKQIAETCKAKGVYGLKIVGHTDGDKIVNADTIRENPTKMNLELGARRAVAVANALKEFGYAESRMLVESHGSASPRVSPEKTNADKAKNRRVEIYFLEPVK
ncbi:MAG: hypothetical protein A2Z34_11660 [Planctomycetes bacterium RBG_16_59_8]|nr:MAG: hypothetical protein A2Z34_11660 [Planctomycetes bacterium RBG_16_59_8]